MRNKTIPHFFCFSFFSTNGINKWHILFALYMYMYRPNHWRRNSVPSVGTMPLILDEVSSTEVTAPKMWNTNSKCGAQWELTTGRRLWTCTCTNPEGVIKTSNDNTIRNQSAANFGGGKLCLYYYSHAVIREKIIGKQFIAIH